MGTVIRFNDSYLANRGIYDDHRRWIESTRESLGGYLIKTELENLNEVGSAFYKERLTFLDTDNDLHNLLFVHSSLLTRKRPVWGGLESVQAQALLKNLDGKRTSAWKTAKEIIWELLSVGAVVLETFAPKEISRNAALAKQNNERSYTRIRNIENLVRWEYFDDEGPDMGKLKEVVLVHRVMRGADGEKYQTYKRLWIEQGAAHYNQQILRSVKPLAEIAALKEVEVEPDPEHGAVTTGQLAFLPITIVGDPDDGVRHTTIYRPINDARVVLNLQSFYDRAGRYAGFERNILATSKQKDLERLPVSEAVMTIIDDPEAKLFTLHPSDPVAIWRNIVTKRANIKYKVLLQFNQGLNPESRESPSVEAKEADQEARKEFYNDLIDEVEDAFNYLFGVVHAEFEGESAIRKDEVAIAFNRDFKMFDFALEQVERTARWLRAGGMGEGGFEIKRREMINDALTMPILLMEGENEAKIRSVIVDKLLEEKQAVGQSPLAIALERRLATTAGGRESQLGHGPLGATRDAASSKPAADE